MSNKEKLEAIKNGQDIGINNDEIKVLQFRDFAKEAQEDKGTVPEANLDTDELPKPDTIINPEAVAAAPSFPEPAPIEDTASIPETPMVGEVPPITNETDLAPQPFIPIDINVNPMDSLNASVSPEIAAPTYEQPFQAGILNSYETQNSTEPEYTNNSADLSGLMNTQETGSELFSNIYDNAENDTKVVATVVTKADEIAAKQANMRAYERLYDAGPGNQISILRNFGEEAAKWISAADKSGFVSGEMHDMAKKILREYEGLKEKSDAFSDDVSKIIPMPASNNYYNVNDGSNILPFPELNNVNDEEIKKVG